MNTNDYGDSALLCFPVELYGVKPDPVRHVTLLYLPEVTATPSEIAKSLVHEEGDWASGFLYGANTFREAGVNGSDAFGVNHDIPVLTFNERYLRDNYQGAARCLQDAGINYSTEFDFRPHMTVPLVTALRPPAKVLLRPLELWYRGVKRYIIDPKEAS